MMDEGIKAQYQDWISGQQWDYFFTGTFRKEYSVNGARRAGERFFQGWPTLKLGILFIESGDLYGRIHLHGVLRFDHKYTPAALDIFNAWFERYGRSKVEIPRSQQDVTAYCIKYVTKHLKHETYIIL